MAVNGTGPTLSDDDTATALQAAHVRQAETDELVAFLRHRCATLRSALERTARELADARQALDEGDKADDSTEGD